ncbi:MarR family transcriptional regulator [[Mycobacterium] kokjensenii]|uniref:MarR family transcriptional regulator n=1 Tax=[Mycobacterium] kokjensenii TaxID=3064287 RepID=A0ABM9LVH9_9MYCO|nr:MarR family transcriptional regulator [Mycolicibacter sp. MU0083]CAJ1505433.1 MarR family transcriptional regulator [Mycolicibacter sp. MU0083]
MGRRTAIERAIWELPALDPAEGACVQLFMESSLRLFAALNHRLITEHGLPLFGVLVLDLLARSASGSVRMGDIAEEFAMAPSRVTQLITRLEARGLVARRQHPGDRRAVLACITDEGRGLHRPAVATYARAIRVHYLERLSRPQAIALGDVCRRTGAQMRPAGARRTRHSTTGIPAVTV